MPQSQQEELRIEDLLSQQNENNTREIDETKKRSELLREKMKNKQRMISPALPNLPANAANSEQPADEQSEENQSSEGKTVKQSEEVSRQETRSKEEEKKIDKKSGQEIIKKIRELDKNLDKLEKLNGKYKATHFIFLTFLAAFIDSSDLLIDFCWATGLLIPVALSLMLIKQMSCAFIWIKINKISKEQETGETIVVTLAALIIEIIPFVEELPATIVRVLKAWNAARKKFEEREGEIKDMQKERNDLIKKLGRYLYSVS